MQRALLELVLLGVVGGILGCWIVLYELSYSAESLAHALFPGLVGAALLGLPLQETLAALALTSPPEPGGDFEVREVATLEDYILAQRLDAVANGMPVFADDDEYARMSETARARFLMWLAFDDGRAVGMARCAVSAHALMMIGGSVLPDERGRGVYRALVAARWETAVERGIPALVTGANEQSAPILRRLGFDELGAIDVYVERLKP